MEFIRIKVGLNDQIRYVQKVVLQKLAEQFHEWDRLTVNVDVDRREILITVCNEEVASGVLSLVDEYLDDTTASIL